MKTLEEVVKSNEELTLERDELREEIERLRRDQANNVEIIEKLRTSVEKSINIIAEQRKCIDLIGLELEEKTKYINKAEGILKEKFLELYEEYKAALHPFGAEPYPYPADGNVVDVFEWMKNEFESLPEVITGLNDYAASFCLDSTLQFLEDEDCDHFLNFAADDYDFPSASELGSREKTGNVKATKLGIFRQLWAASWKEYIQELARERLKQEKEKAAKLEAESKDGVDKAGAP
uniref:Uncharacterized protein n=1 Tax=Setaria viridis TaxID=4556 RepID=A0A4U6VKK0_SETVI|nr:hypothetical protein SEVIR_2G019900v2 [Setaria viridis]